MTLKKIVFLYNSPKSDENVTVRIRSTSLAFDITLLTSDVSVGKSLRASLTSLGLEVLL